MERLPEIVRIWRALGHVVRVCQPHELKAYVSMEMSMAQALRIKKTRYLPSLGDTDAQDTLEQPMCPLVRPVQFSAVIFASVINAINVTIFLTYRAIAADIE
jgi:hypothetical protein